MKIILDVIWNSYSFKKKVVVGVPIHPCKEVEKAEEKYSVNVKHNRVWFLHLPPFEHLSHTIEDQCSDNLCNDREA